MTHCLRADSSELRSTHVDIGIRGKSVQGGGTLHVRIRRRRPVLHHRQRLPGPASRFPRMRIFLAINLPHPERSAIYAATRTMRAAAPGIAWVSDERLHLTLKFLGEQPEEIVAAVRTSVREMAVGHRPISLTLGGLGAFPNLRQPRIVWMGVQHEPRLELMHHDMEVACAKLGLLLEGRAFRPHLTLGRVKKPLSREVALALRDAARATEYTGSVNVTTIDLMQSTRAPAGSRYSILDAAPLGGG